MASKSLLSDGLWDELKELSKDHGRIRAAISYVTASYLDFGDGDLLICDASDKAIKGGLTCAKTLRKFFDQGAEIYSYLGLHSKVALIDDKALIGSANLSANAGVGTLEASLLSDDKQIAALINGFVETTKTQSTFVDEEFIARIEALPVIKQNVPIGRKRPKVRIGEGRLWFIGTVPMSERLVEQEQAFAEEGEAEAKKLAKHKGYEIVDIRWAGKSRFRSEAKSGDLVIQSHTEKRGSRKFIEVFEAVPICYRQEGDGWTRFWVEQPIELEYFKWKEIEAMFKSLGVLGIKPGSVRELTGNSRNILELMK